MMRGNLSILVISAAAVLSLRPANLAAAGGLPSAARPNVVVILADDLGWRDTTVYGSTFYETPNIERLARRGLRFTQAYAAAPICSPTRASILTGLHPARLGITTPSCHEERVILEPILAKAAGPERKVITPQSVTRLKTEYYTLAEALHDAGYVTGHFGKWHLGREPYDPLHQGFDVDLPHWWGPGPAGYIAPWKFPPQLHFTGKPGEHIEDRMAEEAVRFLHANRDRPFFLNYWAFSVHSPYQGKPELLKKYQAKADPANPQHNPCMGAMVQSLDEGVGRLLDALDELKLAERTLLIFTSDNGGVHFKGHDNEGNTFDAPLTSNAPLRGGKGTIYEGGTREPCIVVWPGQVAAGATSDVIIQSVDWFPTILDILGRQPPAGLQFDGTSILPALRQTGLPDRDAIFCFFPHDVPTTGCQAAAYVRQGDWKLIRVFCDGPDFAHRYELYNLKEDLGETHNLAETQPDRVRAMDARLERFLQDTHAVVPCANPQYNPAAQRLDGWRVVRNANLSVAGGKLLVEGLASGIPVILAPTPKASGDMTLEIRLQVSGSGVVRAFWKRANEASFPADRAVKVDVPVDGQWHEGAAHFRASGAVHDIRLDLGNANARSQVEWVRLKTAEGKLLREWNFGGKE